MEAPEAGLEPATRSLSAPGEPTSNGAVEATTGPEVPPSSGQPANSRPRNRHRASGARDLWRRRSVRDTERRGAVSKLGAAMPGRSLFSQVSAPSYTMCTHPHKSTGTACGTACQSPLRCSAARSGQVAQLVEQRTEKTRGLCGPLVLFSGPGTHPPHLTPSAGTDRQTLR